MCVCVCVCVCVCACTHMCVRLCVYTASECECVYECVHSCLLWCLCMLACKHIHMCVCVCVCVCACMCVCARMCVCVCVCAPMCRSTWWRAAQQRSLWWCYISYTTSSFAASSASPTLWRPHTGRRLIIIIIIAFKGAFRDFIQSPHSAANCLQHVRSSGPGAIVCKSRATHRALITCKRHVTCHLVRRDSSAVKFDRVEIAFIWALFYWQNH